MNISEQSESADCMCTNHKISSIQMNEARDKAPKLQFVITVLSTAQIQQSSFKKKKDENVTKHDQELTNEILELVWTCYRQNRINKNVFHGSAYWV